MQGDRGCEPRTGLCTARKRVTAPSNCKIGHTGSGRATLNQRWAEFDSSPAEQAEMECRMRWAKCLQIGRAVSARANE